MNGGMIEQYMSIKNKHKNAILFFQVGGFFQLFYYDAEIAKEELGMKLRSRAVGNGQYAPMCGFPVSSQEKYCQYLTEKGYEVVVCVQTSEKDQDGKCVRRVTNIEKPKVETEEKMISSQWQEYFETHSFETPIEPLEETRKRKKKSCSEEPGTEQSDIEAAKEELWECLARIELNDTTPMMALLLLQDWKKRYVNGQRKSDRL